MRKSITVIFLGIIITVSAYFCIPQILRSTYQKESVILNNLAKVTPQSNLTALVPAASQPAQTVPPPVTVTHEKTPDIIKGIYMSECVVGTPNFREKLVALINQTELNAVVIDIKDSTGKISFPTDNPVLKDSVSTACGAKDMSAFIAYLHQNNIYVIGRVTTFQDLWFTKTHPELAVKTKAGAVWRDTKGQSFIDVGAKPFWDYIVALGKESYATGFDELNFDYIRFPSDGDLADTDYTFDEGKTKAEMVKEFSAYLHDQLKPTGVILSADLFGMTTTATNDMGIGQVLVDELPNFDFIDPMVYPSHFGPGWGGFKNPAEHPTEIIKITMDSAIARAKSINQDPLKIRPWLQDFSLGAVYNAAMVDDQIKATTDAGLTSWLLWSAANTYTADALIKNSSGN